MRKLYILRPIEGRPEWEPWYDKCFGMVVCAMSEEDARKLANENSCDESTKQVKPWLDHEASECRILVATDKDEVIISDIASA